MSFGERMRFRRGELRISRAELAGRLGVSSSAVSNYENGLSFPKEDVMLRLFDCLETDPNSLFRDYFREGGQDLTSSERALLRQYRALSRIGKETVRSVAGALCVYQEEMEETREDQEPRMIPLYRTPAAAGYASPVFGTDFDYIPVTEEVPRSAEYAVRISGDSMTPYIADGQQVYVNRDPLCEGDIGIFCVDGDIFCKQYYRDPAGVVYLFSLNRQRADADVVLPPSGTRGLACLGRVIMHARPLPGKI